MGDNVRIFVQWTVIAAVVAAVCAAIGAGIAALFGVDLRTGAYWGAGVGVVLVAAAFWRGYLRPHSVATPEGRPGLQKVEAATWVAASVVSGV